MIVFNLRRLAARMLDRLADAIDPDVPLEMVEDLRPETDWDAVESECAQLVQSLDEDEVLSQRGIIIPRPFRGVDGCRDYFN